jgi:hypothetical protein
MSSDMWNCWKNPNRKTKEKKKTKWVMAVSIYWYGSANWISTKKHKSRDSTLKSKLSVNIYIWRMIIKGNYYFKKRKLSKTILSNHPLHIKGSENSKNTGLKLKIHEDSNCSQRRHCQIYKHFFRLSNIHWQTYYIRISLQNQLYMH